MLLSINGSLKPALHCLLHSDYLVPVTGRISLTAQCLSTAKLSLQHSSQTIHSKFTKGSNCFWSWTSLCRGKQIAVNGGEAIKVTQINNFTGI